MRFDIKGTPLPVVVCKLDAGEKMITERGAMSWMSPNIKMETKGTGGLGKMIGRAFTRESMFQNIYTAEGGPGMIAFASSFPGSIVPFDIDAQHTIIAQKSAFLASTAGVELSTHFQKKVGAGLVGGEGFLMQKLSGEGLVFLEFDGHIMAYELKDGESMIVDTGYLAAMESTVEMKVQTVPGVKNAIFGGEGLFNTVLTGPGKIWLQTMPLMSFAGAIAPYILTKS